MSGASDHRIACRKVWKATEVAIGGYEFTHAVPETQGRDACVMDGWADQARAFNQRLEHRPVRIILG